jgi:MoxR-like ATPase
MMESSALRALVRSLTSKEPVHILLVGPPGQAKTLFLKCILETFGEKKGFFTVGGNASKSGLLDVLFNMQPKYLLIDEIEYLKPEYQTMLLSLMETAISTQTIHSKVRHIQGADYSNYCKYITPDDSVYLSTLLYALICLLFNLALSYL